jgi:hypothetical protein
VPPWAPTRSASPTKPSPPPEPEASATHGFSAAMPRPSPVRTRQSVTDRSAECLSALVRISRVSRYAETATLAGSPISSPGHLQPYLEPAPACAFLVGRRRVEAGVVRGVERVGWWLALPAYGLLTVGLIGVYWTPFLEETFNAIAVPSMLLSIVGSLVLGIGLLRRRVRPLAAGALLVAYGPLFFVISDLVALGAAMLPVVWAWGLAGRHLARTAAAAPERESATV